MARSPFVYTTGYAVSATASKVLGVTLNRSYLAIFNPEAADLFVALGGEDEPGSTDYFVIPTDSHYEFHCPPASAVWMKGAGSQTAVVAEAK